MLEILDTSYKEQSIFVFVKNEKLAKWLSLERAIDHSQGKQNLNQSKNERKRKYKKSRGRIK